MNGYELAATIVFVLFLMFLTMYRHRQPEYRQAIAWVLNAMADLDPEEQAIIKNQANAVMDECMLTKEERNEAWNAIMARLRRQYESQC